MHITPDRKIWGRCLSDLKSLVQGKIFGNDISINLFFLKTKINFILNGKYAELTNKITGTWQQTGGKARGQFRWKLLKFNPF